MSDIGFTHVALPVSNMDSSIAFHVTYTRLQVVHRRTDPATGAEVAWLSDRLRPFVLVLISGQTVDTPLLPLAHLGVGCESREEVDRLCAQAQREGRLHSEPIDSGYPVGYWAFLTDPDGHTLEVSFGQEIALKVEQPEESSMTY